MNERSAPAVDDCPWSTTEVGYTGSSDGDERSQSDDGPGTTWNVGSRHGPTPLGGNYGYRTAPVESTPHCQSTPFPSVAVPRHDALGHSIDYIQQHSDPNT